MNRNKEVVVDNEFITVWYYSSLKIVHHQFHRFTFGEKLQEAFDAGAELFEKHGAKKWLSDDRKNSTLRPEDTQWTATVWRPRVLKAGWKYWAIVTPEAAVGRMIVNKLKKAYDDLGVTIQTFEDPDEALTWLEAQ